MAKTFDNISESSATNYLFLFAQRTIALQNEPPTPPPLNALGLPCEAICRLWARMYPEKAAAHKYLSIYLKSIGATRTVADTKAAGEKAAEPEPESEPEPEPEPEGEAAEGEVAEGEAAEGEAAPEENAAEQENEAAEDELPRSAKKEKTLAEKIQPLAETVTEYILNHQDDAAEEEHWRTTMKREIGKSFRIQNKKIDEQGIKMDMTIQLVKDLAKQHHFSGD